MTSAVTDFVDVGSTSELPVGRVTKKLIGDRTIALCHTASGFYALDNTCPHRGGPLSEGDVIGEEVICPWHLWGFEVATGNCGGSREVGVAAHEVRVENGRIFVRLAPPRPLPEVL